MDIACDPDLVRLAKSLGDVPVCVSSVVPEDFVAAVNAGVSVVLCVGVIVFLCVLACIKRIMFMCVYAQICIFMSMHL